MEKGKREQKDKAKIIAVSSVMSIIGSGAILLPFLTPEQQDGGIEPPPVLSSRFFRFLNLP